MLTSGQSLSLQAQISGLRQLVNVRFFEPYLFGSDWSASVDLYDQMRIYQTFTQTSLGGTLTLGYPIIAPWLRFLTGFISSAVPETYASTLSR